MSESNATQPAKKPGYKSTEFWLTLIATAIGALLATGLLADNQWVQLVGAVAAMLTPAAYARGRSLVKASTSKAEPVELFTEEIKTAFPPDRQD